MNEQQVAPDHYDKNYETKSRFACYWHQINETLLLKTNRILEIGMGIGIVPNYLRNAGAVWVILDFDAALKPDITRDITAKLGSALAIRPC